MTEEKGFVVLLVMLLCNLQFKCYPFEQRGQYSYMFTIGITSREGEKYFIYIKREYKLPFKEWFCPSGHVGLERNDSQCRPPETNCHWPPWIFQGTLDWKWTIQFPTGSLAISSLCIIETASGLGSRTKIFTGRCVSRLLTLKSWLWFNLLYAFIKSITVIDTCCNVFSVFKFGDLSWTYSVMGEDAWTNNYWENILFEGSQTTCSLSEITYTKQHHSALRRHSINTYYEHFHLMS